MSKVYHLKAEQILNLRNNLIISEALDDTQRDTQTTELADSYKDNSMSNINQESPENVSKTEQSESVIFGSITRGLYNYARNYNLANKISEDIERNNPRIIAPVAAQFIDELLYGVFKMANDPAQNAAFERFLRSIGVTIDANLLAKGYDLARGTQN